MKINLLRYVGFAFVLVLFAVSFNQTEALSQPTHQSNKCYFIARNLKEGDRGADVVVLQKFLKELGYYDSDNISGYFGPLTRKAVEKFQCNQLKICSGTPYTTGYGVFGPKTREKFNELCANLVWGTATQDAADMSASYTPIITKVDHKNIPEPRRVIDSTKYGYFHSYAPNIIKIGSKWHMFYCSNGVAKGDWDSIRYSTSNDGINWSKPEVVLRVTNFKIERAACDPSVIYYDAEDGPYYYLYYSGNKKGVGTVIFVARSKNIEGPYAKYTSRGTWEVNAADPQPIITPVNPDEKWYGAGQSSVVVKDGVIYHWFTDTTSKYPQHSKYNIFLSKSTNPVKFNNPVVTNVEHDISVDVKYDKVTDQFIMFAMNGQHTKNSHITARVSKDGINWSNPVSITPLGVPALYAHNIGVSGTRVGAFIRDNILIGFGGAASGKPERSWGKWDLYMYAAKLLPGGVWKWIHTGNDNEPVPVPKLFKVAEYLFDEVPMMRGIVVDNSGNNNHGVLENGARIYQGTRAGGKLELDGIDDRVKVNSKDSLNNLLQFTITAWIRPENNSGIIIRKGNTNPARFNFGINDKGNLYLRVGYNGKAGVWETVSTVPKNTWSHVAVTYDTTTKTPKFFINGKKQKIRTVSFPKGWLQLDTPYMYIGNNHDLINKAKPGKTSGFKGRMDKIFIFNKVLTDKEIATLAKPEAEVQPTPVPPAPPTVDDADPMPIPGVVDPPYNQPPYATGYVNIRGPEYLQVGETGRWTADVILAQPVSRKPSLLAAAVCGFSKLFGIKSLCPEENYPSYLIKVDYGDGTNTSFSTPKNQSIILEHAYKIPDTYTITVHVLDNQKSWFSRSKPIATGSKKVYVYSAARPMPIPGVIVPDDSQPPIYELPPFKDFTPEEIKDAKPMPMPRVIVPSNPQQPPQIWDPDNEGGDIDVPGGVYLIPNPDYEPTPEDIENATPLMPGVIDQTGPTINDAQPMPIPGVIIEGEPAVWQVQ